MSVQIKKQWSQVPRRRQHMKLSHMKNSHPFPPPQGFDRPFGGGGPITAWGWIVQSGREVNYTFLQGKGMIAYSGGQLWGRRGMSVRSGWGTIERGQAFLIAEIQPRQVERCPGC